MIEGIFNNSYFGIILSFAAYEIGKWINSKVKTPIANPAKAGFCLHSEGSCLTGSFFILFSYFSPVRSSASVL